MGGCASLEKQNFDNKVDELINERNSQIKKKNSRKRLRTKAGSAERANLDEVPPLWNDKDRRTSNSDTDIRKNEKNKKTSESTTSEFFRRLSHEIVTRRTSGSSNHSGPASGLLLKQQSNVSSKSFLSKGNTGKRRRSSISRASNKVITKLPS